MIGKIEQLTVDFSGLKKTIEKITEQYKTINSSDWDYKIIIKRADNGFILENPSDDPDDFVTVYEVVECDGDEKGSMKRLLEIISEFFGITHNKFSNENLKITWDEEGSHYEPPSEDIIGRTDNSRVY